MHVDRPSDQVYAHKKLAKELDRLCPVDALSQAFEDAEDSALDRQEGGSHYQGTIQPIEFIMSNNLSFCQGNAIKYIFRYKDKNGIEDLRKAKHYIDFMIEELEND